MFDRSPRLFGSFFLGGFESSMQRTLDGRRLDQMAATQHDRQAREDYALCRGLGIRAVREAARWYLVDRGGALDLSSVRELARLGREMEVTQIWDLFHYGYPDDLDPFSTEFCERFVAYARAVASVIREESAGTIYFVPVNELSYYSWAAAEVGFMAPFQHGRGREYKRALVRASIAASNGIWEVDPGARMVNVDPLVRLHPPVERPDLRAQADAYNQHGVFEAFDMLAGRVEPELGGSREHLGIVGVNYYAINQWTIRTPEYPQRYLSLDDPRRIPLADMLVDLHQRYRGPVLIAETGAIGKKRPRWIRYLTSEAQQALARGAELEGICFYPIITSPDWEDPTAFFDAGLFDVVPQPDGSLKRVLDRSIAMALREAQAALDPENVPSEPIEPEAISAPEPHLEVLRPMETRVKSDEFSYYTLLAGESLVVEVYLIRPGGTLAAHRHHDAEHVLTVISGEGEVRVGEQLITLHEKETLLVPTGVYHKIYNAQTEALIVQQVSAPKPWDARYGRPHPNDA